MPSLHHKLKTLLYTGDYESALVGRGFCHGFTYAGVCAFLNHPADFWVFLYRMKMIEAQDVTALWDARTAYVASNTVSPVCSSAPTAVAPSPTRHMTHARTMARLYDEIETCIRNKREYTPPEAHQMALIDLDAFLCSVFIGQGRFRAAKDNEMLGFRASHLETQRAVAEMRGEAQWGYDKIAALTGSIRAKDNKAIQHIHAHFAGLENRVKLTSLLNELTRAQRLYQEDKPFAFFLHETTTVIKKDTDAKITSGHAMALLYRKGQWRLLDVNRPTAAYNPQKLSDILDILDETKNKRKIISYTLSGHLFAPSNVSYERYLSRIITRAHRSGYDAIERSMPNAFAYHRQMLSHVNPPLLMSYVIGTFKAYEGIARLYFTMALLRYAETVCPIRAKHIVDALAHIYANCAITGDSVHKVASAATARLSSDSIKSVMRAFIVIIPTDYHANYMHYFFHYARAQLQAADFEAVVREMSKTNIDWCATFEKEPLFFLSAYLHPALATVFNNSIEAKTPGAINSKRAINGDTIAHKAAKVGSSGFLITLYEYNYDFEATNQQGQNALHAAVLSPHIKAAERRDVVETICFPALKNAQDKTGRTPLHYAADKAPELIEELVTEENCCLPDQEGFTPLLLAARAGAPRDAIEALLEAGASSSELSPEGESAITLALKHGQADTAQTIISHSSTPRPTIRACSGSPSP